MPKTSQLFQDDEQQDNKSRIYNNELFRNSTKPSPPNNVVSDKEKGFYKPEATEGTAQKITSTVSKVVPEAEALTLISKALYLFKKNKTYGVFGIFSLFFIFFLIFGMGFLVSHEIVTIEEDLLGYETKAMRYVFNKVDQKLMNGALCRHLSVGGKFFSIAGCSKNNPEDTADTADTGTLNEDLSNFDFTDPQIQTKLAEQGVKVNVTQDGQFQGLTDSSTGEPITLDELSSHLSSIENLGWNAAQINTVMPLSTDQAGAVWSGIPDEPNADVNQTMVDEIVDGSSTEASLNNSVDANNPSTESSQAAAQNTNDAGGLGKVLNAADTAIQEGKTSTQALSDAESAASDLGNTFLVTQLADIPCSVEQVASKYANSRVPEIMSLLLRHGSVLLSDANQIKDGKITGKAVKQVMSLFNSISPSTHGSFTSSAAWLRITGKSQYVNSTNEISPSSLPTANAGTKLVSSISKYGFGSLNIGHACGILTSKVGGIIQGLFGLGQLALDIGTIGLAQIGISAAILGAQSYVHNVIIPTIVKYFTPIGLSGLESSVQWLNNADAGSNIMFNNYARRVGGEPLTNQQSNQLAVQATKAQNIAYASMPLQDRLFSFSDPRSLVSSMAVSLPTGKAQFVSTIVNYFLSFPKILVNILSSIVFSDHVFAGSTISNPGAPYGITQYGFTTKELNNLYNPISNEAYLRQTISFRGHSATRIDLLGDPNKYPGAATDGSTTDILHCFTQGFAQNNSGGVPANFSSNNNDPLCGSMGNFDIANDSPQPITNTQVAESYCLGLLGLSVGDLNYSTSGIGLHNCIQQELPQAIQGNDIERFRQYLLETSIMYNYASIEQVQ